MKRHRFSVVIALLLIPGAASRAGLLAHYSFDSVFTDVSGNGNDLTAASGTPTITTTAGRYKVGGGALDIDSTTSTAEYLNLATTITFGATDARSQ